MLLGISAYYHDAAACLVKDGEIIAAAQEERFTRKKHDSTFPKNAIAYCLYEARLGANEVGYSARVQTVHKETNPRFYNLIR
jgi:carbamoyltransferase